MLHAAASLTAGRSKSSSPGGGSQRTFWKHELRQQVSQDQVNIHQKAFCYKIQNGGVVGCSPGVTQSLTFRTRASIKAMNILNACTSGNAQSQAGPSVDWINEKWQLRTHSLPVGRAQQRWLRLSTRGLARSANHRSGQGEVEKIKLIACKTRPGT